MEKSIYLFIFGILLFISSTKAEIINDIPKCKTGEECFAQSKVLLKEDRDLLRSVEEDIKRFIDQKSSESEKDVIKDFEKMENIWVERNEIYRKNFNETMKEFKNEEESLRPTIEDLNKLVEKEKWILMKKNHMYRDAIIHYDIVTALEQGLIKKIGAPTGWDDTSYRANNKWNGQTMIRIGTELNADGNGLTTNIPEGYDVLWLRNSNEGWGSFKVYYTDGDQQFLGIFCMGYRGLNEISPDGGSPDAYSYHHMWTPIRVTRPGSIAIISNKNNAIWISGIAFGKNLWGHAKNSAVAYHWGVNGGTPVQWETHNWNTDVLARINAGQVTEYVVPVVNNGKDKILYIIEYNYNWLGSMHTGVSVQGTPIERFRTSYSGNPFATHINSKIYSRYLATIIPKNLINGIFVTVQIDMRSQDNHIYFREIGTHDLN